MNSSTPAVITIQKEHGELFLNALITDLLVDTVNYFSVGKSMGQAQVVETVKLLIETFPGWKLDDFVLCFKNAKRGFYGKSYDRIDGQVIFKWCNDYNNDRMENAESLNRIKHENYKNDKRIVSFSPEILDALKKITADLSAKKEGPSDLMLQKWFSQFNLLCGIYSAKVVNRYKKTNLDTAKFIDCKIAQFDRVREMQKNRGGAK